MIEGTVIYGIGGRRRYACRALDERALFRLGDDPDRLLASIVADDDPSALGPADLPHLPLVDYELILAHVCAASFGATIGQNVDCGECGKKFSVEFSLPDWIAQLRGAIDTAGGPRFEGVPFALPTRARMANAGRDKRALVALLWKGDAALAEDRVAAFEQAVAAACPLLADGIVAPCPACGEETRTRFVLREHLATRLRRRFQGLVGEIHLLASTCHWSAAEILALPRRTRSALIETISVSVSRRRALGSHG